MTHAVRLTRDASRDLEDIADFLASHESPQRAAHVLDRIGAAILALGEHPHRGPGPPELTALGIRVYRQVFFKPYRIIYRIDGPAVHVMLVADGRRDMQALLERRLLAGR